MKLNKIVLGVAFAMGMASFAQAAETEVAPTDQGSGSVKFMGSIVDAPCSIVSEKDQTIDMGQIANTTLANGGSSAPQPFKIELAKCNLADKYKTVSVTFTGSEGGIPGALGAGNASGASIIMTDGSSNQIKLGTATALQALANGTNTLSFSAFVKGNPDNAPIQLGNFENTANFTLAYQ